jgi:uncharacterized membrane protein YeiB
MTTTADPRPHDETRDPTRDLPRGGAAPTAQTAPAARARSGGRIDGIDLARFVAIVGMMIAHLVVNDSFRITEPASLLNPMAWPAVFDGRSSTLFGVLAGVSVAIVAAGPLAAGGAEVPRLRLSLFARGLFIAILGLALEEVQQFIAVVLTVYGFVFMVLALFVRLRPARLLAAAAVTTVLGVASTTVPELVSKQTWESAGVITKVIIGGPYPLFIWVTFGLVGLAVMRLGLEDPRVQRRLVVVGSATALVAYGLGAVVTRVWSGAQTVSAADGVPEPDALNAGMEEVMRWQPANWQHALLAPEAHSGGLLDIVGSAAVALAVLGACLLVCRNARVLRLTAPLRAAGSMPLTVYVLHVLTAAAVMRSFAWQDGMMAQFRAIVEQVDTIGLEAVHERIGELAIQSALGNLVLFLVSLVVFPVAAVLWKRFHKRGPAEELLQRSVRAVCADRPPVRF